MDVSALLAMFFVVFIAFLVVYCWQTSSIKNRLSDIESLTNTREDDLKAVHNAIGQLNKNQKLFVKRGEPVIVYRQKEKFEQGQGDA